MRKRVIRYLIFSSVALLGAAIALTALPASATTSPDGPARPGAGPHICYQAYVTSYGWMDWVCDGDQAGTTGQNRAL